MRSSAPAASKRSWHTIAEPLCSAPASICTPPTQKNGMAHSTRCPGYEPGSPTCESVDVLRTTVPCVCTTALGSAALPEVYTTTTGSAGLTSDSTAASNSSLIPVSSTVPNVTGVTHERWLPPTTQIVRR